VKEEKFTKESLGLRPTAHSFKTDSGYPVGLKMCDNCANYC